jgi:hypothetical protein
VYGIDESLLYVNENKRLSDLRLCSGAYLRACAYFETLRVQPGVQLSPQLYSPAKWPGFGGLPGEAEFASRGLWYICYCQCWSPSVGPKDREIVSPTNT